ncbi:unnamed protein product [Oppiella nova]|uniref:C2H2-type domain-containing protein n=1 Tax=Oppiella nova TaxID=334625 RepID=A0A7R9QWP8_9ACAR|nr:unnamed protein product [Oppiella nova]CAG2176783.1 unnamed protein product [Oppiella nova]
MDDFPMDKPQLMNLAENQLKNYIRLKNQFSDQQAFDKNLCETKTQFIENSIDCSFGDNNELNDKLIDFRNCQKLLKINANYNDNQLSDESEEHREIQGLNEVLDENSGDPEAHVVSEDTQEVQTLDTEVDERDRDETEGPEEVSEVEENGESGVGEDDREGNDNCEPIASTSSSGAKSVRNERPFVCFWPNCGKRFAQKPHLNQHNMAVHLKLKTFTCDVEGCGQLFSQKSNLHQHKRFKHSGEKPFKCDYSDCGKCFARKEILNEHKNVVHLKEKRFKCDYMDCDKRFAQKPNLNKHINAVHLKLKLFVCDEDNCGKNSPQRQHLLIANAFIREKSHTFVTIKIAANVCLIRQIIDDMNANI